MRSFPGIEFRLRKMLPKPDVYGRTCKRLVPYWSATLCGPKEVPLIWRHLKALTNCDLILNPCDWTNIRVSEFNQSERAGGSLTQILSEGKSKQKLSRSFNLKTLQDWRRLRSKVLLPVKKSTITKVASLTRMYLPAQERDTLLEHKSRRWAIKCWNFPKIMWPLEKA